MIVKGGSVDVTTYFAMRLVATGADATALTISDFDLQYTRTREVPTAKVDAVALAATNTAHTDNRGIEVDATDQPGLYRFDWPDAAFATGTEVILSIKHTSCFTEHLRVTLVAYDFADGVRLGLTALPNAAAEAAGGLYTRGTGAGQINQPANGMVDANVVRNAGTAITAAAGVQEVKVASLAANAITATAINADAFTAAKFAADVTTELQSGLATAAALATVDDFLDTEIADIQARLPAALVSGRIDASVGAMAANVMTAAAAAADLTTELQAGLATAAALTTVDDFLDTEIAAIKAQTDLIPAAPAAVGDIPTAAIVADAVWDEAIAGHLGAGSTGLALNSAGAAGDPWSTALPGAYGAGTAGKIIGDNINATVSSRATQTSVDDVPTNAELATALGTADDAVLAQVALVKAQTDLIPSDPADASVIAGRFDTLDTSVADLPTNAELATALGTADDAVLAAIATVQADTDNIQTRIPAALVSGRMDSSAGAIASGAITATAIAANAIGASELAADAVTEIADAVWAVAARTLTASTNFNDLSAAQVNAEVVDALATDTYAEPTGVPAATASLASKIGRLHMALRNRVDITATKKTFYDDGDAAEWEQDLSDDGTVYSQSVANAL